jgi:hypothetical protein
VGTSGGDEWEKESGWVVTCLAQSQSQFRWLMGRERKGRVGRVLRMWYEWCVVGSVAVCAVGSVWYVVCGQVWLCPSSILAVLLTTNNSGL